MPHVLRLLAPEHGVGLGAGRDQDGARRQHHLERRRARIGVGLGLGGEPQRPRAAEAIEQDLFRRQPFGEPDALLQRLRHLFVVERVARRIDHAPPIDDGGAAPLPKQLRELRLAAFARGLLALGADRARMLQEFGCGVGFLRRPAGADGGFAALLDQGLVAAEELLDLQRIIGERLGGGVDRGEPAADDHDRQAHLQVGEAVGLGGAGELQRHQEVGGLAHAGGEPVLHRHDGRAAGAGAQRDVVEAEREGAVDGERAAEAHAAEHRELAAPFQQQADELEEILVPAHGDAVFGDAAEPGHDAAVERLAQLGGIADRAERRARAGGVDTRDGGIERLDLEPVDRHHGVAVVHEMMREREAGGPEAHDQDLAAAGGLGQRPAQIERIPSRQQRVDLEAPGQRQHVLEDAGLDLRNIDRLLLLVDARLHAVVADAVAGRRAHRVVDDDNAEGADGVAAGLDQIHLGDFLVERAAGERHAERRLLELAALLLQPLRAGILALVVAPDAVVGMIERTGEIGAGIGQREAVAQTAMRARQLEHGHAVHHFGLDRNEMVRVDLVRQLEQDAGLVQLLALRRMRRPGGVAGGEVERRGVLRLGLHPGIDAFGEAQFGEFAAEQGFELAAAKPVRRNPRPDRDRISWRRGAARTTA